MARFLLVAPPLAGHVLPLTAVARERQAHGHLTSTYDDLDVACGTGCG